tara:strand:+ start:6226 stop:6543 length:318 start_codon:yes stop_codon:yes gene_type:complete
MTYRVIKENDEITIITEDGGVACVRYADELDNGDGRQAVTDYYQDRLTQEMIDSDIIWEQLGEGKMYCNDWTTSFDNHEHITDALQWLCPLCETWEYDTTIWKGF